MGNERTDFLPMGSEMTKLTGRRDWTTFAGQSSKLHTYWVERLGSIVEMRCAEIRESSSEIRSEVRRDQTE